MDDSWALQMIAWPYRNTPFGLRQQVPAVNPYDGCLYERRAHAWRPYPLCPGRLGLQARQGTAGFPGQLGTPYLTYPYISLAPLHLPYDRRQLLTNYLSH